MSDRLGRVVLPVVEPGPAFVADPLALRWIEVDVVDPAAVGAAPASGDPLDQNVVGSLEHHDGIHAAPHLGHHLLERFRLGYGSREPVEDHARLPTEAQQALPHELHDEIVGHEITRVHVRLGLSPQLGALPPRCPQQVAGHEPLPTQGLREQHALSALSDSRGTQQDDDHHIQPGRRPAAFRLICTSAAREPAPAPSS
jgi:hypothetical protein